MTMGTRLLYSIIGWRRTMGTKEDSYPVGVGGWPWAQGWRRTMGTMLLYSIIGWRRAMGTRLL